MCVLGGGEGGEDGVKSKRTRGRCLDRCSTPRSRRSPRHREASFATPIDQGRQPVTDTVHTHGVSAGRPESLDDVVGGGGGENKGRGGGGVAHGYHLYLGY